MQSYTVHASLKEKKLVDVFFAIGSYELHDINGLFASRKKPFQYMFPATRQKFLQTPNRSPVKTYRITN